jgi:hypothetical protein
MCAQVAQSFGRPNEKWATFENSYNVEVYEDIRNSNRRNDLQQNGAFGGAESKHRRVHTFENAPAPRC